MREHLLAIVSLFIVLSPLIGYTDEKHHMKDLSEDREINSHHHEEDHKEHHDHHKDIELTAEELRRYKISLEPVRIERLAQLILVNGIVRIPHDKNAHIRPRFPGIVIQGYRHVGDWVEEGEKLATLQSNKNLQEFSLYAPFPGVITEGHLVKGEYVAQGQEVFTVVDTSIVWIDFKLPPTDLQKLRPNSRVVVELMESAKKIETKLSTIFPIADEHSQLVVARSVTDNKQGHLHPGHVVIGHIDVEKKHKTLVVDSSALQRINDKTVVFVKKGKSLVPQEVTLGPRGLQGVEIVSGISSSDTYALGNTFLLKAELLKEAASHSH